MNLYFFFSLAHISVILALAFLLVLQLSLHCLFPPVSLILTLPAARLPMCISAFQLSSLPRCRSGEKGPIDLSETGSANLDYLSPTAGNYLEVGTGPGNCRLHRPPAQDLLLHASPLGGLLDAVPRM